MVFSRYFGVRNGFKIGFNVKKKNPIFLAILTTRFWDLQMCHLLRQTICYFFFILRKNRVDNIRPIHLKKGPHVWA